MLPILTRRLAACGSMLPVSLAAVLLATAAHADQAWDAVLGEARGQTVFFNGWGGSDPINDYIQWAADRVEELHGVEVRHVRVGDIAESVSRVLAEKTAGRDEDGSIDVLWINGENFAAMKRNGLLGEPFVDDLPNFRLVDTEGKPTTLLDFTVPTDGLEAPWGMAQLTFMHDSAYVDDPPRSIPGLLDWARDHPGRFTYALPPDFLGTTFLKQALIELIEDDSVLERPAGEADFEAVTAPLWDYLDRLHPHLWRSGATFPPSNEMMLQLLDDGEIDIAYTFNPAAASAAILDDRLPETVRTFIFDNGTIGNTHFLAIPYNAGSRAGAKVLINFLLSPEAQARKEDPRIWGDPTVLDLDALGPEQRRLFEELPLGPATLPPEERGTPLPEPHPTWMDALEAAWQERYAA